jgi:hemoglobin/transferrin/lactoferrin receptor protein
MKRSYILMVFFSVLGHRLSAQETADSLRSLEMEVVVVSATRSLSNLENIPIKIHVVDKKQIEENQPLTPVEALQYIPGVTRQSDGGLASTPIIRGLSRERAPLLIDGNPFVGGRIRSYALMDPFQAERIEVVKGPASAFWGSDAVSGLVNIITRKAENGYGKDMKIGGSVYGGYQSVADFYRGRVELEGRGNGFDFLMGGGMRKAGNTKTAEGEIENSQFESTNFDFNLGYSWAANHRVEISGKYFENRNVGFPGGLGAPGPPSVIRRFDPDIQKDINLAYDGYDISEKIESIGVRLFYKEQNLHVDQITNIPFPNTTNLNRRINAMLDVDVPFMGGRFFSTVRQKDNAKMTFGIDYLREHRIGTFRELNIQIFNQMGNMVNEINRPYEQIQPDSYSNSIGLFAIEEVKLGKKLDLLIAGRLDNVRTRIEDSPFGIEEIAQVFNSENSSSSDLQLTGNIGMKYQVTDGFSFTTNLANSFRGPDLFSKYHFAEVGQGFLVPNPNLNSETGVFYELGTRYRAGILTIEANFYQNFLNNLFEEADIIFDDTPSVQIQNIGEATLTGFEWDIRAKIGALSSVFISGAMINGINNITNNPLQSIPATQLWAGVHIQEREDKFFVRPEMLLVFDQNDPAPNEIETPGYAIFNINTGVNLHNLRSKLPHSKLIFSITNLTDKLYRSHVSRGAPGNQNVFMEPGRSFNIGFVARFGVK